LFYVIKGGTKNRVLRGTFGPKGDKVIGKGKWDKTA
jgi:hypothetical protein